MQTNLTEYQMTFKATKEVSEFNVEIVDNGFTIHFNGRNDEADWTSDKLVCTSMEQLIAYINQIAKLPKE